MLLEHMNNVVALSPEEHERFVKNCPPALPEVAAVAMLRMLLSYHERITMFEPIFTNYSDALKLGIVCICKCFDLEVPNFQDPYTASVEQLGMLAERSGYQLVPAEETKGSEHAELTDEELILLVLERGLKEFIDITPEELEKALEGSNWTKVKP